MCKLNLAILIEVMLPLSFARSSPVLSFLALIPANVGASDCYYMMEMVTIVFEFVVSEYVAIHGKM